MTTSISITSKIKEIKDLHELASGYAGKAIENAIRIGEILTDVKCSLEHGQWIPWIEENLPFNKDQAARYMRVFSNKELVNASSATHLMEAVNLLSEPKPKKEPKQEPMKLEAELIESEDYEPVTEDSEQEEDEPVRKKAKDMIDAGREIQIFCNAIERLTVNAVNLNIMLRSLSKDRRKSLSGIYDKKTFSELCSEINRIEKHFE